MTTSLRSEASGAHRWQHVTVLVISIAGIRSNSGLAGSKTSGAHHWQDVTMLATPITGARSKSNLAGVEDVKGPSPARRHYARDLHHWDPEHQVLV